MSPRGERMSSERAGPRPTLLATPCLERGKDLHGPGDTFELVLSERPKRPSIECRDDVGHHDRHLESLAQRLQSDNLVYDSTRHREVEPVCRPDVAVHDVAGMKRDATANLVQTCSRTPDVHFAQSVGEIAGRCERGCAGRL